MYAVSEPWPNVIRILARNFLPELVLALWNISVYMEDVLFARAIYASVVKYYLSLSGPKSIRKILHSFLIPKLLTETQNAFVLVQSASNLLQPLYNELIFPQSAQIQFFSHQEDARVCVCMVY